MPLPFPFDFKKPDYNQVFEWRFERLKRLNENKDPLVLANLRNFYKYNPAQYIIDWGCTYDPRNPERGLPALIPFFLFEKQEECIHFVFEQWRNQESGVINKSRDMGASEFMVGFAVSMCFFWDGFSIGFGSRRKDYVDNKGDPKALLYKARRFIMSSPSIFRGEWDERKHSASMRINFPATNSIITGDSGDQIGRGDRKSMYVPDEFAFIEHQDTADAALAATTNCVMYVSTPNGPNVLFCKKATEGKIKTLTMNWRDDPRRDQEWADKKQAFLDNDIIWRREYENDHYGSLAGVIIPLHWVEAAIDAHVKLGITIEGKNFGGLDIADGGKDKNVLGIKQWILYHFQEEWSGAMSDLYATTEKAIERCDFMDCLEMSYDASGLGANVKGDSRKIFEKRKEDGLRIIKLIAHLGGSSVIDPEKSPFRGESGLSLTDKDLKNKDLFYNLKAQSWWMLQRKFYLTYRAVVEGAEFDPNDLVSICSKIPLLGKLKSELSQAVFVQNSKGQLLVDKTPDNMKSPNLADAMVIAYAPYKVNRGFFSDFEVD